MEDYYANEYNAAIYFYIAWLNRAIKYMFWQNFLFAIFAKMLKMICAWQCSPAY